MARFEYEGDVQDLSARQREFINNFLEERGYKNNKVNIEPVGKAGDNYVAKVKRLIVNDDGKLFKMIVKIAPGNEIVRKMMNTSQMFKNEHFMYSKVLPKFAELENDINLPQSERLKFAKCYSSFMEEPNELILLEDMCVSNFNIFEKFKSMSSESVKLVLRSFAILHSLSYALKHQNLETFAMFSKNLVNMWELIENKDEMKMYFSQLENDVIALLDNEFYKNVVKGSITQISSCNAENNKYYRENNNCVIQQGDSWTNNIMFRLEGDNVVECCMIDYQLSNENSPVADIHYMIFNCTDYETRSKHYHEWIDYYHTELDKRLSNFGLRAKDVYPRDQLNSEMMRQGKVSFGLSIMLASMLMREHHEAANFKAAFEKEDNMQEMLNISKLSLMESTSMARFKDKVNGLIKSFLELGYLK